MKTKKVFCSYDGCNKRRIHYERPEIMRARQMFEVPYDHLGPWYCSIECACYDGVYNLKPVWTIKEELDNRIKSSNPDRLDT